MLSHGIPPVIVAGMLGHSISVLMNTYAHFIPTMQSEAAQLMDDNLTPIQVESVRVRTCQHSGNLVIPRDLSIITQGEML